MARQVFIRFKALLMEPSALTYAERHDNIEAIYKKLEENTTRRISQRYSRSCTALSMRLSERRSPARTTRRALQWI
jgi:hypothetical protein